MQDYGRILIIPDFCTLESPLIKALNQIFEFNNVASRARENDLILYARGKFMRISLVNRNNTAVLMENIQISLHGVEIRAILMKISLDNSFS